MANRDRATESYAREWNRAEAHYYNDELYEAVIAAEDLLDDNGLPRYYRIKCHALIAVSTSPAERRAIDDHLDAANTLWLMARHCDPEGHNAAADASLAELRIVLDDVNALCAEEEREWREEEEMEWREAGLDGTEDLEEDIEEDLEEEIEEDIEEEDTIDQIEGSEAERRSSEDQPKNADGQEGKRPSLVQRVFARVSKAAAMPFRTRLKGRDTTSTKPGNGDGEQAGDVKDTKWSFAGLMRGARRRK